MRISNEKKLDILLILLKERYESAHKMRERSLNFATWILGFGIAISWMLLSGITLTFIQKIILTSFIVILGIIVKKFLVAIENGFNKNREIMVKIEEILELYKKGSYIEDDSVYPSDYKEIF